MAELGRPAQHCRILFGMQPIVGESEAEAREKQEEHNALMPLEGGMTILSAHADYDLSKIDLEAPMADRTEPELQRLKTRFRKASGESMTLREVAQRHGQSVGLPQFVGTPRSIADQMEAFLATAGGDGFMLSPIYCPGAIEEFVDLVVPELQRRGLVRREYRGRTMRDLLRQEEG
jgi:alkanesulfonate monooxygenase SsuD/methylene tetrahydromethanopterin reductase-like flavin-dependent oxidoreductase (luciferase family)